MPTKKQRYSISLSKQGDIFLRRLMKTYGTNSVSLAIELLLSSHEVGELFKQYRDYSELNSASLLAPRSVSFSSSVSREVSNEED